MCVLFVAPSCKLTINSQLEDVCVSRVPNCMSITDLQLECVRVCHLVKGSQLHVKHRLATRGVCVCFVEDPQLQVAHRLTTRVCVCVCVCVCVFIRGPQLQVDHQLVTEGHE